MTDSREFNERIIKEFRENNGVVGAPFEGATLLLLTTTGSKTGLLRTTPLVYLADGDRYVIIASKGGAPENPSWYNNIVAGGEVSIEVGTEKFEVQPEIIEGKERVELYARQEALMPGFKDYRLNTSRIIPVIALTRKN